MATRYLWYGGPTMAPTKVTSCDQCDTPTGDLIEYGDGLDAHARCLITKFGDKIIELPDSVLRQIPWHPLATANLAHLVNEHLEEDR